MYAYLYMQLQRIMMYSYICTYTCLKAFPLVQNTATVWDIILLLGAARLPALCAAFFMAQKHALYDLLPQVYHTQRID